MTDYTKNLGGDYIGECPNSPEDPISMDAYENLIATMEDMCAKAHPGAQDSPTAPAEPSDAAQHQEDDPEAQRGLGEGKYEEVLHPRGRGGKWTKKFNLPQQHEREPDTPDIQAVTAPASGFSEGDHVTYQHGLLGKLDGTVTRVRGEWPKQKIDVSYKVDGEPRSSVMTTDQAAVKLEHAKPDVQAATSDSPFTVGEKVGPGHTWGEVKVGDSFEFPPVPGAQLGEPGFSSSYSTVVKVLKNAVVFDDNPNMSFRKDEKINLRARYLGTMDTRGLGGVPKAKRFTGESADAHFLGDMPVPVGQASPKSPLMPDEGMAYGEAIRAGIARHPEIVGGEPPLGRITFMSDPQWADLRPQLQGVVLAVAYRSQWGEQRLIINDVEPFPVANSWNNWTDHAPSTQVPLGTMTHEMGHAFARVHGYGEGHDMQGLFSDFGITPRSAATVSTATGGDVREAFAELYGQTYTPGFKIEDPELQGRFLTMVDFMRARDEWGMPTDKWKAGGDMILISGNPELQAEQERAIKENLRTNTWDAETPLLDALRTALGDDSTEP